MQVTDLLVYKKLFDLALNVNQLTLKFPKFEMFELGSQLRRSSNSGPANIAEGFGSKHTNIFTETISRAQGEIRETMHHLRMAYAKNYLPKEEFNDFIGNYETASKMLYGLEKSLNVKRKP